MASSAYRQILKTCKYVFKGDTYAITAARQQLRSEIYKNKSITDKVEIDKLIAGLHEADEMLRYHIVQGRRNDRGNYDVNLSSVESQTTIEARQDNPLGAEIQPIDTSVLGNDVKIDTVTNKKCSKK